MKNDWLTASSFERTFDIVSAVNILSIHYKLTLADVEDPTNLVDVQKAKVKLLRFLNTLQSLIENAEKDPTGIIAGTDSQLGELALQYKTEQKRIPQIAFLYTLSFPELNALISSEKPENLPKILDCLDALRSLFDQHSHADITGVFGDE